MKWSRKGLEPTGSVPKFKTLKTVLMVVLVASVIFAACRQPQKMADQPYYEPLETSDFFSDGQASRHPPEGTVSRGTNGRTGFFHTGKINGKPVDALPFPVTAELLVRGRERYDIYCSPCHDRLGTGRGMVVRRGYRQPRSFHEKDLREAPAGEFFEHMTLGFGAMPSYAGQVPSQDRWAIVAYIRALQLSRNMRLSDLGPEEREKLEEAR